MPKIIWDKEEMENNIRKMHYYFKVNDSRISMSNGRITFYYNENNKCLSEDEIPEDEKKEIYKEYNKIVEKAIQEFNDNANKLLDALLSNRIPLSTIHVYGAYSYNGYKGYMPVSVSCMKMVSNQYQKYPISFNVSYIPTNKLPYKVYVPFMNLRTYKNIKNNKHFKEVVMTGIKYSLEVKKNRMREDKFRKKELAVIKKLSDELKDLFEKEGYDVNVIYNVSYIEVIDKLTGKSVITMTLRVYKSNMKPYVYSMTINKRIDYRLMLKLRKYLPTKIIE